jgi:hypothetical protein
MGILTSRFSDTSGSTDMGILTNWFSDTSGSTDIYTSVDPDVSENLFVLHLDSKISRDSGILGKPLPRM